MIVGWRTKNKRGAYEGAIFDVRIWNRPLTNGEIVDIYESRQRDINIQPASEVLALASVKVPMDN